MRLLERLGIAAQARLITWLSVAATAIAVAAGGVVFGSYEAFRREIVAVDFPLMDAVSRANVELASVQRDLLDLIDQARAGAVDEPRIYRDGRRLLDRVDAIPAMLAGLRRDHADAGVQIDAFRERIVHYRGSLASAIEMMTVSIATADSHAQRAARDALEASRATAGMQQRIGAHLADDAAEIDATLVALVVPVALVLVIATLAALALLERWSAEVVRTFGAVRTTLARLRAGDTAEPVAPVGPGRESGDVTASLEAFRGSLIELATLRADLESKVDERTRQLQSANDALSDRIDRLRRTERELRVFRQVFDSAAEGIVVWALDGTILHVNDAFTAITGRPRDAVVGRNVYVHRDDRIDPPFWRTLKSELERTGRWSGEIRDRRAGGEVFPATLSITSLVDERARPTHFVAVFSDISRMKATESQLERLAYVDRLTGLPNRRLVFDRLEHAVALAQRSGASGAVLSVDLDRFKHVNDTLGHHVGDRLLIEVGERLKATIRDADTVGRLGGDEFLVVLEGLGDSPAAAAEQARTVAARVVAALSAPYGIEGAPIDASACVGIRTFGAADAGRVEAVLSDADAARHEAKRRGRGHVHLFDPAMQERTRQRNELEQRLRAAVRDARFALALQPLVDRDGAIVAAEALIRWNEPGAPPVSPAEFIPLAEELQLIGDIGRWVIDEACRLLARWRGDPVLGALPLAVNVSARQFADDDFVGGTLSALERHGVAPSRLKLELTESVVVEDLEGSIAKMRRLQAAGIRLAMDDFGTGYSSLAYLRRLPFDQIKIDRGFVASMLENPSDRFIVDSVLKMGALLGVEVVAEGVETAVQRDALVAAGCALFQGYLFARPMPADAFEARARQEHAARPPALEAAGAA